MTPEEEAKFEADLCGILNALEHWFYSQGIEPEKRMLICQIYTATLIRAVAATNHSQRAEQEHCRVAGIQFALGAFPRAINGGYSVDGIATPRRTN